MLRQRRLRDRQKSNRFRLAKLQLCTCSTLVSTFLCRHCTTTTCNCPNNEEFLFLFLNLNIHFFQLQESSPVSDLG